MKTEIRFTRVNCNSDGHPREVVHFLELVNDADREEAQKREETVRPFKFSVSHLYDIALSKARKINGRKFHNKQYGGGIVFVCWDRKELEEKILNIKNS